MRYFMGFFMGNLLLGIFHGNNFKPLKNCTNKPSDSHPRIMTDPAGAGILMLTLIGGLC